MPSPKLLLGKVKQLTMIQLKTMIFNYILNKSGMSWILQLYYYDLICKGLIALQVPAKIICVIMLIL